MGAWGYGPFDNDDAQDWLSKLYKGIAKGLNNREPNVRWAAVEIIRMLPLDVNVEPEAHVLIAAENTINELLRDEWLTLWQNPKKVRVQLMTALNDLKGRLDR